MRGQSATVQPGHDTDPLDLQAHRSVSRAGSMDGGEAKGRNENSGGRGEWGTLLTGLWAATSSRTAITTGYRGGIPAGTSPLIVELVHMQSTLQKLETETHRVARIKLIPKCNSLLKSQVKVQSPH